MAQHKKHKKVNYAAYTASLRAFDYEPIRRKKVTLPDRSQPDGYTEPNMPRRYIPTPY